jgi:hypothetical protein
VVLAWEIGYLILPNTRTPDRVYTALLKIAICFTAIISYINDKEKMLVISSKGLLVEKMIMDEKTLKEKLSFAYIVIAIIYNPILPVFYTSEYWVVMHLVTIIFFGYKVWCFKRQLP